MFLFITCNKISSKTQYLPDDLSCWWEYRRVYFHNYNRWKTIKLYFRLINSYPYYSFFLYVCLPCSYFITIQKLQKYDTAKTWPNFLIICHDSRVQWEISSPGKEKKLTELKMIERILRCFSPIHWEKNPYIFSRITLSNFLFFVYIFISATERCVNHIPQDMTCCHGKIHSCFIN